ncbi:MAG: ABC transporter ATP-binding protein [Treponema sp.]|jgi:oligopeptide/dipeptide ABC transporter ATP-binding protein|nr:ABC transporter ATP-binding protein [Treponema sp.]
MATTTKAEPLLEVSNLKTSFRTIRGLQTAVDGISFTIGKGEIVGVVGESGCGKSVTSKSIMRLYDEKSDVVYDGQIMFQGQDLMKKSEKEMEKIRGNGIAMVFQDALSSLNPLYTVGKQISESLLLHKMHDKKKAMVAAEQLLRLTGIPAPEQRLYSYPHELSGGMRQRAMIAMALACEPKLLIADEPTTALDVTIQAQIMRLILDLNKRMKMGILLITHDLGVVAQTCQRVLIIYLGHIVEEGTVDDIFDRPLHPYTKGLLKSLPGLETKRGSELYIIKGTVPSLEEVKQGCRFYNRCPYAEENCGKEDPELLQVNDTQKVRCFYTEKITKGEM